jgi:nicotinic acid phosphoribosyltransferase
MSVVVNASHLRSTRPTATPNLFDDVEGAAGELIDAVQNLNVAKYASEIKDANEGINAEHPLDAEKFPIDAEKARHSVLHMLIKHQQLANDILENWLDVENSAAAYNDLYKYTMLPVMWQAQKAFGSIACTFSINIRSSSDMDLILNNDDLQKMLVERLALLGQRTFDVEQTFEILKANTCMPENEAKALASAVCLDDGGNPRTLFQRLQPYSKGRSEPIPGGVIVDFYIANDDTDQQRVFVEATGPWHHVTWLETTLMQAVYSCIVEYKNVIAQRPQTRYERLAECLFRTALSVAAVNATYHARSSDEKLHSLFAGRRTMGMDLMVLQTLYLRTHLRCFAGTSSVTAASYLKRWNVAVSVVGTHAHELSMVLSAVLGEVDANVGVPLSQVVGHLMYLDYSSKTPTTAALPDTLGVKAFVNTALPLVHPPTTVTKQRVDVAGVPVLELFSRIRQDSGSLEAFEKTWKDGLIDLAAHRHPAVPVRTPGFMASEISGWANVVEARDAGYLFTGAGGFYGDSLSAWGQGPSVSVATKAVKVWVDLKACTYQPVKTGDAAPGATEKLEYDRTGNEEQVQMEVCRGDVCTREDVPKSVAHARRIKKNALNHELVIKETEKLQEALNNIWEHLQRCDRGDDGHTQMRYVHIIRFIMM